MAMNGYVDDMMCEGLFDNIEDLLDFSSDDEVLGMGDDYFAPSGGGGGGGGGGDGAIQMLPAAVSAAAAAAAAAASSPSSDGEVCRVSATSDETKFCDEINIHEDWITNFLDDSNFDIDFPVATGIVAAAAPPSNDYIGGNGKGDDSLFQSFSPVSVLDEPNNLSSSNDKGGSSSSSSSSTSSSRTNGTTADTVSLAMAPVGPTMMLVPARARSKRPRRAAPAPAHVAVPIVPPASEGPPAVPTLLPECESFGESDPCALLPMKKKKKKKNQNFLAGNARGDDTTAARKCQHCGLQKTPQWRAGPMGPKTLCNACGVRYKSGRLFPEYRPAASPTFMAAIHSNSHKKVVEMRIKACQQKAANGMPSPEYPAAKNCDLLAYIRRRE